MRIVTIPAAAMLVVGLTFAPAFAGQHGHSTTLHGGSPKALPHTQPTTEGQARATRTTTTTTRAHGSRRTSSSTTTSPIAAKISSHPQQAARIERMLPPGMTLAAASNGFRNQGQFIAALHVS